MFSRILVGLLIVTIQACPLRCTAAVLSADAHRPDVVSCCAKCRLAKLRARESQGETPRLPASPVRGPQEKAGQCVCCGAVVEKVEPFRVALERSFDNVAIAGDGSIDGAARSFSAERLPMQHPRSTPGRLVCCLNMLLLC